MSRWFAPLAVIVLLAGLGGCVTPQKIQSPSIVLQDVKLLNTEGLTQHLQVELLVSNPNDFDIPLTGLKFGMQMNGLDFAEGLSNQRIDIPRLGRAVVPVEVTVSVLAIMKQIQAVQKKNGVDYRVAGTVYLDHILLPSVDFDRQGKVDLNIDGRKKSFKVM
ncbi:MAG: LEA type 2 family protein [Alphaproteobacteria bacterium]|nr:LEA type 2 family protein [Alphaproteobacteria bacterium]MCK5622947.1 LEA type 2 family protein [Alphaproteobacteria bacterium]